MMDSIVRGMLGFLPIFSGSSTPFATESFMWRSEYAQSPKIRSANTTS